MSEKPIRLIPPPEGYAAWLTDLKGRSIPPSSAPPWL